MYHIWSETIYFLHTLSLNWIKYTNDKVKIEHITNYECKGMNIKLIFNNICLLDFDRN